MLHRKKFYLQVLVLVSVRLITTPGNSVPKITPHSRWGQSRLFQSAMLDTPPKQTWSAHTSASSHQLLWVGGEEWGNQQAITGTASSQVTTLQPPHPLVTQHSGIVAKGKNSKGEVSRICSGDEVEGTSHYSPNTNRTQNPGLFWPQTMSLRGTSSLTGSATGLTHLTRVVKVSQDSMRQAPQ